MGLCPAPEVLPASPAAVLLLQPRAQVQELRTHTRPEVQAAGTNAGRWSGRTGRRCSEHTVGPPARSPAPTRGTQTRRGRPLGALCRHSHGAGPRGNDPNPSHACFLLRGGWDSAGSLVLAVRIHEFTRCASILSGPAVCWTVSRTRTARRNPPSPCAGGPWSRERLAEQRFPQLCQVLQQGPVGRGEALPSR